MIRRIAIRKDWTISMSEFRKFAEKYQWKINELEEENKKLKLENAKLKDRIITDENFEEKLDKENKNLKEKVETLELWLDNKEKLNEEYRKQIDDKRMELSTIAEETIADLQSRIKELEDNEKYRHSRCMKAERQYEHSLWDDELIYEEWLYD